MLEPPPIPKATILAHLHEAYDLPAETLAFLPLGVDMNTAVYRAQASGGGDWFVKLRSGPFVDLTVEVPRYLADRGMREIITPLRGKDGALRTRMGEYTVIVYPFIEGNDAYQVALNEQQWVQFGAALRRINDTLLPAALADRIPREDFHPRFREAVTGYLAQAETGPFFDEPAAGFAWLLRSHRAEIEHMLRRAGALAKALSANPPPFVLCHADIHAGNLHLTPGGDLYIVDWDEPLLAPKEHDMGLIGGCGTWRDPGDVALFYQGYHGSKPAEIDPAALAYYRYERTIADISAFGELLFLSDAGGVDRAQSLVYCSDVFEPGKDVELAIRADEGRGTVNGKQ